MENRGETIFEISICFSASIPVNPFNAEPMKFRNWTKLEWYAILSEYSSNSIDNLFWVNLIGRYLDETLDSGVTSWGDLANMLRNTEVHSMLRQFKQNTK